MTNKDNKDQSAFGYGFTTADGMAHSEEKGLTKREYLAGLAMQGLIAQINVHEYNDLATYSVRAADALLKQLEKQTP